MKFKLQIIGALLALVLALSAACGDSATSTQLPTSTPVPQINQVSIEAFDYGFTSPDTIPAGMTTFTGVNAGQDLHHQQLISLAEGMSVEDLLTALAEGEPEGPPPPGVEPAGGVAALGPGVSGSVTMNLAPGNYVMVCFIADQNGVPHLALGMVSPLTVTAATGPLAAEPAPDLDIGMIDFGFEVSAPISAGTQTILVTNDGEQEHEAFLVQLAPGATAQDFLAAFEPDAPPGPPPGLGLGGLQSVAPGMRGTIIVDFAPANYAFICFVGDPDSGAPHFALGMLSEFTVQ